MAQPPYFTLLIEKKYGNRIILHLDFKNLLIYTGPFWFTLAYPRMRMWDFWHPRMRMRMRMSTVGSIKIKFFIKKSYIRNFNIFSNF